MYKFDSGRITGTASVSPLNGQLQSTVLAVSDVAEKQNAIYLVDYGFRAYLIDASASNMRYDVTVFTDLSLLSANLDFSSDPAGVVEVALYGRKQQLMGTVSWARSLGNWRMQWAMGEGDVPGGISYPCTFGIDFWFNYVTSFQTL